MSYWDTSALAKLYVKEPDSLYFEGVAAEATAIFTSRLTFFELRRVLYRKEIEGSLKRGSSRSNFLKFLKDTETGFIQFVALGSEIELHFENVLTRCLTQTPPVLIRTADAIHLAAALTSHSNEVVCTDKQMCAAGKLLDLVILRASPHISS